MKKITIFGKIFIPIIELVIVFAVISFVVQYFTIDTLVKRNAKNMVEKQYNILENDDKNNSQIVTEKIYGVNIYAFDEKFDAINKNENDEEFINFIKSLLVNFELNSDEVTTISYKGKEYLSKVYETKPNTKLSGKAFLIYQELSDKALFLRANIKQAIFIQIIMYILLLLTMIKVSRSISNPLKKLAYDSKEFTIGNQPTIVDVSVNVKEIDELKDALYNLQIKINEEDKAKNIVYENVAHDLRTPLVSILGYADAIKNGIVKDVTYACDIILKNGNQLKEMVENILLLSRFDNHTYKSYEEEFDVYDKIYELIEMLKYVDSEKNISINEKNGLYTMTTDKRLFERIIQNLIINAIKYSDKNINVDIIHRTYDKIKICISNDGKTIDDDTLSHLFERYYKGKNGNIGIGLSVVKNAVEYIGGNVEVESKNDWTTFTIIL